MPYVMSKLNNIGGSTGRGNLWIYTAGGTLAEATIDGYFNPAINQGMRDQDIMIVTAFDGAAILRIDTSGGNVTLTDLQAKP